MIERIKQTLCSHKEVYSFRTYNDFDFTEYQKCKTCGKTLDFITGFDEDLRG
ncbi:MAG: hypothetical protein M3162_02995 [Thermoproteota archaeon]|nr:hypothetical protein [Thermoproteota archaeon]